MFRRGVSAVGCGPWGDSQDGYMDSHISIGGANAESAMRGWRRRGREEGEEEQEQLVEEWEDELNEAEGGGAARKKPRGHPKRDNEWRRKEM